MGKLFDYVVVDGICRVKTFDDNILYIPVGGDWVREFWRCYYQVLIVDQYAGHRIQEGDIVFDCGAQIGMFSLLASKQGAKSVYAFEPYKPNVVCLEKLMRLDKQINVIPFAVGNFNGMSRFTINDESTGSGFVSDNGEHEVLVYRIDDVVSEFKIDKVNFIKMDVEGSELSALEGAAETIHRNKPRLAISAYHNEDDFRTIPNLIKSIRSDYEIKVVKVNNLCETVMIGE
ncbi:MAG: hypothetical protein BWY74_01687 [Firmicutes bacterium ADurb.Bin419]|nr:MAG: hypothetical protein BWY74_01687 [Firmicutes bacterium ADurb.Bin419]